MVVFSLSSDVGDDGQNKEEHAVWRDYIFQQRTTGLRFPTLPTTLRRLVGDGGTWRTGRDIARWDGGQWVDHRCTPTLPYHTRPHLQHYTTPLPAHATPRSQHPPHAHHSAAP